MKYLVLILLLATSISTSHACRLRNIDIVNEAANSENVSIGVVTSVSSVESESHFSKMFEHQNKSTKEDTNKIVIGGCGCKSSYQLVAIRSTSVEKVKGKPSKFYDFDFKMCMDSPSYALFSKLAIFDFGGGSITWKQIDETGIDKLREAFVDTANQ